ncbi:MAG TPA: hypothetical protein VLT83_01780, partial [Opitutaceae bacterium]|nr:hypothetical protein [Opitutaceae bacterium]
MVFRLELIGGPLPPASTCQGPIPNKPRIQGECLPRKQPWLSAIGHWEFAAERPHTGAGIEAMIFRKTAAMALRS